jgi:ABC-type Zn uptake system ZnuABC Zn-binding protein ZnuA
MKPRWPLLLLLPAAALLPLIGCGGGDDVWDSKRTGPKVVVSFAPLYCIAVNVAGPDAQVKNMMTTTGPHDFNPTDQDARLVAKADLLLINGLDLDNQLAETLKRGSGNRTLAILELGKSIPEAKLMQGECHHNHAGHDHPHSHGLDPHIWLSPEFAVLMTEAIRDQLVQLDPAHAEGYKQRAAEYVAKLKKLEADGKDMLKGKADRKLVTFHESLNYFAKNFDLEIAGVVQKKPGVEPNSDELEKLVTMCGEKKVRLIAVEPQYGRDSSAKAILAELHRNPALADAALVELDPLETVTPAALTPDWYVNKMRANLEALRDAMK